VPENEQKKKILKPPQKRQKKIKKKKNRSKGKYRDFQNLFSGGGGGDIFIAQKWRYQHYVMKPVQSPPQGSCLCHSVKSESNNATSFRRNTFSKSLPPEKL